MAKTTIFFAVALIALGLVGYFGTPVGDGEKPAAVAGEQADDQKSEAGASDAEEKISADNAKPKKRSITAMIPSFVGALLLLFGVVALNDKYRMHAMHGAVLIGLLGFLAGGSRVVMSLNKVFGPEGTTNWRSFWFVLGMTVICAVFVAYCVNSFIQARRQRKEEELLAQRQENG